MSINPAGVCEAIQPKVRRDTFEQAMLRQEQMAKSGRNLKIDENVVCDKAQCNGKNAQDGKCKRPIWLDVAIRYLGLSEGGDGTVAYDDVERKIHDNDGPRHNYTGETIAGAIYDNTGQSKDVKEFFEKSHFTAPYGARTFDSQHAWCGAFVHTCFVKADLKSIGLNYTPPSVVVRAASWKEKWGDPANPPCLGAVVYKEGSHCGFIVGKGEALTNTIAETRNYNNKVNAYKAALKQGKTSECPVLKPRLMPCYFLLGGNQGQEVNITPYPIKDIDIKSSQVPKGYKWCKQDEVLENTKWVNYWKSQNPDNIVKSFSTR